MADVVGEGDSVDSDNDLVLVPFVVQWFDYGDEWTAASWQNWSFHRTREGAELAAAQFEALVGHSPWDVRVLPDWTGFRFEVTDLGPLQG